jgi:inner membrane protein
MQKNLIDCRCIKLQPGTVLYESYKIQTDNTLDSLTHIVLGACIGEVVAGKNFGKKAMLAGALAQSIPDVDFITRLWLSNIDHILAHRGFTHSILFAVLMTIIMSLLFIKFFHKEPVAWRRWFFLFGLNLFTHIFIDSFNAYGVGWFEPFSHQRFSFNVLFVADPFFSVWPFVAFVFMIFASTSNKKRRLASFAAIAISTCYLIYAIFNKRVVEADVKADLKDKHITTNHFFTTPSPFNSWLWFAVAEDLGGYHVAYRSVFDTKQNIDFHYFPRSDSLLQQVKTKDEVNKLLRFAQGYYTVEKWNDTLVFNVLRFGQVVGWYDPTEKFAFHYFLDTQEANDLVVQRGRFEKWNRSTFHSFVQKIKGD